MPMKQYSEPSACVGQTAAPPSARHSARNGPALNAAPAAPGDAHATSNRACSAASVARRSAAAAYRFVAALPAPPASAPSVTAPPTSSGHADARPGAIAQCADVNAALSPGSLRSIIRAIAA